MAQRFREMLASVDHTVHLIMDFKDNVTNPLAAISIFNTATKLEANVAPNMGLSVLIEPGIAIEMSISMTKRLARRAFANIATAKTLQDAYAVIDKYIDATSPA